MVVTIYLPMIQQSEVVEPSAAPPAEAPAIEEQPTEPQTTDQADLNGVVDGEITAPESVAGTQAGKVYLPLVQSPAPSETAVEAEAPAADLPVNQPAPETLVLPSVDADRKSEEPIAIEQGHTIHLPLYSTAP